MVKIQHYTQTENVKLSKSNVSDAVQAGFQQTHSHISLRIPDALKKRFVKRATHTHARTQTHTHAHAHTHIHTHLVVELGLNVCSPE